MRAAMATMIVLTFAYSIANAQLPGWGWHFCNTTSCGNASSPCYCASHPSYKSGVCWACRGTATGFFCQRSLTFGPCMFIGSYTPCSTGSYGSCKHCDPTNSLGSCQLLVPDSITECEVPEC